MSGRSGLPCVADVGVEEALEERIRCVGVATGTCARLASVSSFMVVF